MARNEEGGGGGRGICVFSVVRSGARNGRAPRTDDGDCSSSIPLLIAATLLRPRACACACTHAHASRRGPREK